MGNVPSNRLSRLLRKIRHVAGEWWHRNDIVIAIYGLDAAGAATILYHVANDTPVTEIWTFGLWREYTRYRFNTRLHLWKLRLNPQLRRVWIRLQMREKIKALIWVVEANDHNRFVEGRDALKETLDEEDVLRGTPVLVLANKQDLPGAVNVTELAKVLELQDIHGRPWHIMPTTAITGEGLKEAFEWTAMIIDRVKRGNTKLEYRSGEADAF